MAIIISILAAIFSFYLCCTQVPFMGVAKKDNLLIRGWPTPQHKDPPMSLKVWILIIDVAVRSCLYSLLELILYMGDRPIDLSDN